MVSLALMEATYTLGDVGVFFAMVGFTALSYIYEW